ncbi:unnamed protein product [Adineta steineri]|uniref:NHL repeat containing protein n=1 Tax=Adineta steineri TaxID=433720 RepID=A0A814V261_9BILA|nr:unnamed protein product [Adineta steineri]CAF1413047.1 unnamed protein product [Adineta steineri]
MMSRNQIGSEPVTSNSQQTSTDQSTLLRKCFEKKKFSWIIIGIIFVILSVTIPIVIIKTKTINITKLSTAPIETTNMISLSTVTSETTTADNPTTEVKSKPKYNKWKQYGITIAGGNGNGDQLNQLIIPSKIYIDDNQAILIADTGNHRIIEWKYNSNNGEVIAGGNGQGKNLDQFERPNDVTVDKEKNAIIICDHGNYRVMRWFRQSRTNPQIFISNIYCNGVAIDKDGFIYVSDHAKYEVRRWKEGDTVGTLVAGGNSNGEHLDQFEGPSIIFVDKEYSIYVSETGNNRISKWKKDAKEGIVVAGGNGRGSGLNQLAQPLGMIVDNLGQIFIADFLNCRIMRWSEGDTNGSVVVGGNGAGNERYQLNYPTGLSFDVEGNLYVADGGNHRIQKYELCIE